MSLGLPFVGSADVERPGAGISAPLSLTASDGTGLKLVSLEVRAVVQSPLAFTELWLEFENPEARVLEGHFRVTLPQGATLSRFAMKLEDRWQEGEVLEKQAARRAYEDFLHRRQDPALLEQQAGNEFAARVFPIPARGRKSLVVSYSHELGAGDPFRVALRGLPRLERFGAFVLLPGVAAGGAPRLVEQSRQSWIPDRDLEVALPEETGVQGLQAGELVAVRVSPRLAAEPQAVGGLCLLVDTSASRALGYDSQLGRLRELVLELVRLEGGQASLLVAAFDQEVEEIFHGQASALGPEAWRALARRRALGASDLHGALAWLQARPKPGCARVLLVSDGVATAGPSEAQALARSVAALAPRGVERLDALAVGGIRDEAALRALTLAGLASPGAVLDGDRPVAEVARRLRLRTAARVRVAVEGARWAWPEFLEGLQAGDQAVVYAELAAGQRELLVTLDGKPVLEGALRLAQAERPLLERAAARARLERLMAERAAIPGDAPGARERQEALRQEIVALSMKSRVLCPFTALLVLETEADYQRYGIDRLALADILTVGARGLEVLARATPARRVEAVAAPKPEAKVKGKPAKKGLATLDADEFGGADGASASGGGPPAGDVAADEAEAPGSQGRAGDALAAPAPSLEEARAEARPAPPAAAPRPSAPPRASVARSEPAPRLERRASQEERPREREQAVVAGADPYEGRLREVMQLIGKQQKPQARDLAFGWREEAPGDVLALVALGEASEALGDARTAARAYGSIIDLFPARADLRRYAGQRLERLAGTGPLGLAVDTYRRSAEQRPDHPASHHLLGMALLKAGRPAEAFEAIAAGLAQRYPEGRFAGHQRILAEDLGLAAAAWIRSEPKRRVEILDRLRAAGGAEESRPSLRFVLVWETDANDVDFHIHDGRGGHAFYSHKTLASGGELYADVTTGYGPECFTIRKPPAGRAYPYRMQAHYYSRGPMGYGMGQLQIVEHDGQGGLAFEARPFVVMKDGAYLDLGWVRGPLR
jgi:tetratricopeptide (TPR) repeat protein